MHVTDTAAYSATGHTGRARGHARPHPVGCAMTTLTLLVPGMTCRHCVRKVTAVLRDAPGVQLVQADLTTATVVLSGEPTVADVLAALDEAGFPATVLPAPASAATPARRAGR